MLYISTLTSNPDPPPRPVSSYKPESIAAESYIIITAALPIGRYQGRDHKFVIIDISYLFSPNQRVAMLNRTL